MLYRILSILILMTSVALGQKPDARRVAKGDQLSKVRKIHGTPELEYPLNGKLVQEFEQCTIFSRNGVVISAHYKKSEKADEEPVKKKQPPTIDDIKLLAEQGDAESQYVLAYCYQLGKAIEQNYSAAVHWYRKAAMQGHLSSQHNLGYMYMIGKGVEQNYVTSYMWALLAAKNGNNTLKEAVVYRLTASEKLAGELGAEEIRSRIKIPPAASKSRKD